VPAAAELVRIKAVFYFYLPPRVQRISTLKTELKIGTIRNKLSLKS